MAQDGQQEFKLPRMGESITEGTIIEWHINPGDSFDEGDVLLEVATDKVDNEVPAPFSGKLIVHKFEAGDVVPIGSVIAILEQTEGGSAGSTKKTSEKSEGKIQAPKKAAPAKRPATPAPSGPVITVNTDIFVSPLVDSIARKNHISYEELARIPGTGKDGRPRKSDVINYIEEGRPYKFAQAIPQQASGFQVPDLKFDKGEGRIVEMDRMRQMIADHMVFSRPGAGDSVGSAGSLRSGSPCGR